MITLAMPKLGENRYVVYDGALFGPYDQLFSSKGDLIPFTSTLEAMEESKGIYHENDVIHSSISGSFKYEPLLAGILLQPTALSPYNISVPIIRSTGLKARVLCEYGLAVDGGSSFRETSSQYMHRAWFKLDDYNWLVYRLVTNKSTPNTVGTYQIVIFKIGSVLSGDLRNSIGTSQIWSGGYKPPNQPPSFSGSSLMTAAAIVGVAGGLVLPAASNWSESLWYYLGDLNASASTQTAREKIDSLVAELFPGKYPIEDLHYGDLAAEASKQVNTNKVNMIAFLKDIRKPWELIPKLNKLKSLKGVSGNFLGFQYGILPTISDIKDIRAAFERIKPYVDRNGFTVYTAGVTNTLEQGSVSYSLVQRIKLAVSDEDDEFEALITRLESMGTWPTLENIWDLVPYSFVVDWLVDVGGFLDRVDTRLRLLRLNIRYATMSRKTEVSGYFPGSPESHFVGTVNWVHYHRWVSDQCPVPPLSLQPSFQDFDHWLESGALIIQRAK